MDEPLIRYRDVEIRHQELAVLCHVNLEVGKGEFLYIMGKVGSGKSSLLKTLYAELDIAQGEAMILGYDLRKLKKKHIPPLRRKLGIVFQDFQLLTDRCVYDNLYFVLRATGWKDRVAIESRIEEVLKQVGMANKGYKFPSELSGGEQQRISIARALLNSPELILADEPTGNLDPETGRYIVELLYGISKKGTAVIMSTHNPAWVQEFPATILRCDSHELHCIPLVDKEEVTLPYEDDTTVSATVEEPEEEIFTAKTALNLAILADTPSPTTVERMEPERVAIVSESACTDAPLPGRNIEIEGASSGIPTNTLAEPENVPGGSDRIPDIPSPVTEINTEPELGQETEENSNSNLINTV